MMNYTASRWLISGKTGLSALLYSLMLAGEAGAQGQMVPRSVDEMALRLLSVARTAPEVRQTENELLGKAADVRAADLQKYPKVELQTSLGSASSELPNTAFANTNAGVTAGLRYTVFDAGKSAARMLAAQSGFETGEYRVRRAVEAAVFDAMSSYLQILRYELLLSVAKGSEQALREIETLEARKVALGGAGITDSRVAATRLALSANKLLQFQSLLEEARNSFSALFGFTPGDGELPVARVPAAWLDLGSTGVVDEALARNPEIAEANSIINQSQATASAERAARFPSVDLNVTKRYEFPGAQTGPTRLGLVVTVSTGNTLEAGARAVKAAAQISADESKLAVIRRDVTLRAATAWRRTITGYQREQVLAEAATGSAEVFRARKRLNAAGRETTMALLDAQVEENNVRIDWVSAIFDARLSELKLVKELGKLMPPSGADQIWAASFYQSEDYREVVQRQISAGSMNPVVMAAGKKEAQIISLGVLGRDYTFRVDGLKPALAPMLAESNIHGKPVSP